MIDKSCSRQVLGCLMQKPQFLNEVDKYLFTIDDFFSKFEKYIFVAIDGLHKQGATKISIADIENYLEFNDAAKQMFKMNNGIEYLQDAEEISNVENFDYYYKKLKKINLLRDIHKTGKDISEYYISDLTSPKALEINQKFEELTIEDIINNEKKSLLKLETQYATSEEVKTLSLADGLREMLENLAENPDVGLPIQGKIYNQVINGAQTQALTIRAGGSGVGKTRQSVGDACALAYPITYNWTTCKWELTGNNQNVLFIITEQTPAQIQRMALAYITGINESRFKFPNFSQLEYAVIEQAISLIERFQENFIIVQMPNPTIGLVKTMVREKCMIHDIAHVFYDYIFIGPALLNEFRGFNLRNDEVLLMFATALKDLAVELNVSMMTSTQVNSNVDDNKNIRNESSLAGGRATINKADNGAILARPTKEELETLGPIIQQYGEPNIVTDIFKVRSGEWTQVRIWSRVDLGTLRKEDLFITDSRLESIEDFYDRPYVEVVNWEDDKENTLRKLVEDLNNGVIDELRRNN